MTYSNEFATKGKANAALTTGIIGTGLAGAMALGGGGCGCNNGGLLGGLFGGNNECHVNKTELALSQQVAALQAEKYADAIAREESEKIYVEARRSDDKIAAVIKDTTDAIIQIGNAVAGQAKEIACMQVEISRNREEAKSYTDTKVHEEAQLRACADKNIEAWTAGQLNTKITAVQRIDPHQICGESPLNGCGCGCL